MYVSVSQSFIHSFRRFILWVKDRFCWTSANSKPFVNMIFKWVGSSPRSHVQSLPLVRELALSPNDFLILAPYRRVSATPRSSEMSSRRALPLRTHFCGAALNPITDDCTIRLPNALPTCCTLFDRRCLITRCFWSMACGATAAISGMFNSNFWRRIRIWKSMPALRTRATRRTTGLMSEETAFVWRYKSVMSANAYQDSRDAGQVAWGRGCYL